MRAWTPCLCLLALCCAIERASAQADAPWLLPAEGAGRVVERLPQVDLADPAAELPPPAEEAVVPSPDDETAPSEETTIVSEEIVVEAPPNPWDGSIELGINGSEGNADVLNLRAGINATRKVEAQTLTLNLNYRLNTDQNLVTANRLFFDGRNEWQLLPTPWTYYVHQTTEYDEFRAFDVRITADTGMGYNFVQTDLTKLAGRAGAGVSHEIGGPDDSWVPELVLGGTFERKITERQSFNLTADCFPSLEDFGDYRVNSQANYVIVLDQAANLSLKLSVVDRYDSTPNGAEPNDLDYSATLLWAF